MERARRLAGRYGGRRVIVVGVIGAALVGCEGPPPKGPPALCARRLGEGGQKVHALGVDAAGSFVIAGRNTGPLDLGDGPLSNGIFVAKFDPNCQHVWSEHYPEKYALEGQPPEPGLGGNPDLAVDPAGNVVVSACFIGTVDVGGGPLVATDDGDRIVFKFDPTGAHVWSKRFDEAGPCYGTQVGVDAEGNVLLAGWTAETADFGGGPLASRFVVKLDGSGVHVWSKQWDSAGVLAIEADAAGNVIIAGNMGSPTDFGGGPIGGDAHHFVVKFGPDGAYAWGKAFPLTTDVGDWPTLVMAVAPSGEIVLGGLNYETVEFGGGALTAVDDRDAYLAKLDAAGEHVWSGNSSAAESQNVTAVAIDPMGNVAVGGDYEGTLELGDGAITRPYLARITAGGDVAWGRGEEDGDPPSPEKIAFDGAGNVIMVAHGKGPLDYGNGVLAGNSGDFVIARFAP